MVGRRLLYASPFLKFPHLILFDDAKRERERVSVRGSIYWKCDTKGQPIDHEFLKISSIYQIF